VVASKRGYAMDATTKSLQKPLAEIRQRLDKAASIAKAAQACADSGNVKQGVAIALDVEQPVYNAASLINRITKG
jgi:hypothetical protein